MSSFATVLGPPQSHDRVAYGFDQLARLLSLTLGPAQGSVVCGGDSSPTEVLVDSGVIARRVVALQDRGADVGAMLLRNMVWRMHEEYGDGAATAAVLAWAMVREARRMTAAGVNPMLLRRGLEDAAGAAARGLEQQAVAASGSEALTQLAQHVTGLPELGRILGEIFDLAGEDAAVEIEEFAAPYLEHEYVEGGCWRARPAARDFMPVDRTEFVVENPVILVANQKLERVEHVRSMLELVVEAFDRRPLLLVAPGVSGDALTTLILNHHRGAVMVAAAVLASAGAHLRDDVYDLAALTGSEVLSAEVGLPPERAAAAHFGQARRAVLTRDLLTIVGGGGASQRQARASELRARVLRQSPGSEERERLQKQIARLTGGIGIVKIGAHTARERDMTKQAARKAVRVLRAALAEGLVPGGGAAYLNCAEAVSAAVETAHDPEKAAGMKVVARALEAPFCQLVQNYGRVSSAVALDDVRRRGTGYGFDVRSGEIVRMAEVGIMDSVRVLRGALLAAASAAAMAVTTDVLVLRSDQRRPLQAAP